MADLHTSFAIVVHSCAASPRHRCPTSICLRRSDPQLRHVDGHSVRDGSGVAFVFEVEVIFRHLQLIAVNLETERVREGYNSDAVERTA